MAEDPPSQRASISGVAHKRADCLSNKKRSLRISVAPWSATLLLLYCHGSWSNSIVVAVALSVFSFIILAADRFLLVSTRGLRAILIIQLFSALSILWSVDWLLTARASTSLWFEVSMGSWLSWCASTREGPRPLILASKFLILSSFAIGAYQLASTGLPADGGWHGPFSSKNELGLFAAFAGALANSFGSRIQRFFWTGSCCLLIVLSTSKTSLVALLLVLAAQEVGRALLLPRESVRSTRKWLFVPTMLAIGGGCYFFSGDLLQALGKDPTLTNRTEIWAVSLETWAGNRIVGDGLGATFYPGSEMQTAIRSVGGPAIYTVHNGYLSVYFGLGAVGLLLLMMLVAQVTRLTWRSLDRTSHGIEPAITWSVGTLCAYLVTCFSEDVSLSRGSVFMLVGAAVYLKKVLSSRA
ncbi:O-antigen ligase family protein [Actinomyces polynesiensis]|uniref:O-antigen ligase family protein n=1 Tax=Actinomyces polynesiensis TaxID=1325934 RepID=UPI0009E4FAA8|nr:O-antigen ligase family protein [Actinomyces polynesiensis]